MKNWAGNVTYGAGTVHRPSSVGELQTLVAAATQVKALGSRHCFTDIGDAAALISLDGLPRAIEVSADGRTVEVPAGLRYGELATELQARGLALHNLASLPHISVAGAVSTGTHGSGDGNGNLATAVSALELVTADGSLRRTRRGDPDFDGMVVSLGALGVMTRLTLDVEPAYTVRQVVYEPLTWDALLDGLDAVMASAYAASVFTTWGDDANQVWLKLRDDQAAPGELRGALPASEAQHPIAGMDPTLATHQLDVPGPWFERLPHFRMGFTPSNGEEIQSEWFMPRRHGAAALEALRGCADLLQPLVQVSELRTVAADALWMSPHHDRDSLAIHFTWVPEQVAVERAVEVVEERLAPFAPRPHWGKLFLKRPDPLPRQAGFAALRERLDPRGVFGNAWLDRFVLEP